MVRETRHLWVGNLPETVREDRIRDHFKRYGRVQSVKILLSSNCNPNLLLSIGSSSLKDHNDATDDHSISMYSFNNNSNSSNNNNSNSVSNNNEATRCGTLRLCSPTTNSTNCSIGSVCATVAFMDIKSASKAHTAEHKFDDRVLTTEYYEPSSIPSTSGENSPSSISSSAQQQQTAQQQSPQHGSTTSNLSGSVQSAQQQYSSSTIVTPPTVPHRLSTSNHGSSEDLSPNFVDRNTSYYDRSTRLNESSTSDMYIRRPNNYHHSESRGRPRDRNHYRNGSYSSTVDRSNSSVLHRSTSNTWYENTNSSSRNVYGTLPSAAVVVTPDSAYDTTNDRRTSETECSSKSTAQTVSHRGATSPCADSTTSRSHSRSPSSCSSRQSSSCSSSGSSHSHGSSSPSSSDPSKSKHLQSAVSTPPTTVHSDDHRPLAICVRNLPSRSSDTSLKDGLFHEYKKHGKVTWVKVVGQSSERYALVCFKKPEDVEKALEVSHDKLFFGCKIAVAPYQGFDVDDNEFRPYEAELDEFNPKSTRTLFIGNLEKDITTAELRKNFDRFGEIIEIEIKKQGANAYAFCQYSDIISVVKAIRAMDGEHLGMNRIKLGFGKSMATNCVWIDGVSDAVSENYLSTQFSRFGPVSQATINRDRKMALVFFEQTQYAQSAVKEMRGIMLRGRKLQVDFASRECQDAFYEKLDKKIGATTPERVFDTNRSSFDGSTTLNSRFSRSQSNFRTIEDDDSVKLIKNMTKPMKTVIDTPGSRSRTSSFGRHGNSGAVSPTSGSSTPRCTFVRRNSRYANVEYHDDEYIPSLTQAPDQIAIKSGKIVKSSKLPGHEKSYDEVSQGSADADDFNHFKDRSMSPQTRMANEMDSVPSHGRRKYTDEFSTGENRSLYQNASKVFTKSFQTGISKVDGDRRDRSSPVQDDEQYFNSSIKHHRIQSVVVSADTTSMHPSASGHFQAPSDIRHLQRSHLHEQLEDHSPSSSDEILSPKKRMKFENTDSGNIVQTNLVNDTNCDLSNNLNDANLLHHRKSAEVRRLSECNSLKQNVANNNNNIRRPSTDSGTLRHITQNDLRNTQSYTCIKRRKTGATNSESEHHSKGRGHQLHSHHSHEASASESADGSRPGTPLCDERPELPEPADPRRHTRDRTTRSSPMYLSLPKFGVQTYNQIRAFNQTHSLSTFILTNNCGGDAMDHHTKAFNALSSPPPALLTRPTNSSSISLTSQHSNQISFQQNKQQQQQQQQQPPHPNERGQTLSNTNFTLSRNAHHKDHATTLSSGSNDTPPNQIHQLNAIEPKVTSHNSQSSQSTHTISTSTAPLPKVPHPIEPPKPLSIPPPPSEQPPGSPIHHQQHNNLLNAAEPPYHSNSSDSELANSPSFDERIKNLDEMFEKWNGGTLTKQGSDSSTEVSTPTSTTPSYSSRHKFLDLDVNEVKPSEIVKSVLAKKSIFDDDLKRLENIGEKYEASTYNFTRLTLGGSNVVKPIPILTSTSQLPKLQTQTQHTTPPIVQAHPRLNAVSPMNSPQPQSPYNCPSPGQIVTNSSKAHSDAANQKNQSICSGLQYPFPSHPIPANNSGGDITKNCQDELNNKSKSHSISRNSNHEKANQSSSNTNKTNSSNNHRVLNKSSSVPVGSNHSGTVHPTLKTTCSLNAKDESMDSVENVIQEKRREKREEKMSSKSEERHSKKTELLDRRKWDSTNTDHSDPSTDHDNVKMELEKNRNKVRHYSEADIPDRESKIKNEIEDKQQNKRPDDFDARRRELDNENIAQNWKNEYVKSQRNDGSVHLHRDNTITVNHFMKLEKHNKENSGKSRETTPLDRHNYNEDTKSGRNSRCNSPNKNTTKRRLSSHESVDSDDGKRFKFNQDRRDFKDPNNRSFDKSARHQRNKVNNHQKIDESSGDVEDRSKKDSMFDERKRERDSSEKHRKSEKNSTHKIRKNKDEKTGSAHYLDMESQSGYSNNDVRMSDEESRKSEHNSKDNKRANLYEHQQHQQHQHQQHQQQQQQQQQQTPHRHHGDSKQCRETRELHRDDKLKSEKRMERSNSGNEKSKASSERRRQRIVSHLSSDDSDSDKKKRSIFDIPDDEPVYVSMYDKVKARSCKNMQKQEEEKKIKDKFSQLKESRAKREEKKQTSYDEDTDSDMERNPDRRPKNSNRPNPFMDSSTEDSDGRHSVLKDMMISDSDTNSRNKGHFRRNKAGEICDGESSENSSSQFQPKRRNSSRKNSRSARITSETSDDTSDGAAIKQESNPELKEAKVKIEKLDIDLNRPNDINNEILSIPKEEKPDIGQFKIKTEPIDDPFNSDNQTPDCASNVCDMSDGDSITPSSKASDGKESIFDNIFNVDTNKRKHKKNKKRQKSPTVHSVEETKPIKHETEIKIEKTNSMETVFDELKRDSTSSEKKRHSKKEKKRDKISKEQYDKSKEEKYRMKKLKKQGRLASDASLFESMENYNASQSQKRGEKMENIFGPISDDDLQSVDSGYQLSSKNIEQLPETQSRKPSSDSNRSNSQPSDTQRSSTSNFTNVNKLQGASMPTLNQQTDPEPPVKSISIEKDKHRERKRERKRKEREKLQQSISSKDDDNSVDLDAAARQLEAQLLEDSQPKPDDDCIYSGPKDDGKNAVPEEPLAECKPYDDIFRFSDNEDAIDNVFSSRKSESAELHRSKDKKKKKKKSREEKRHHHHHSSHPSLMSPPTTPRLTIDTSDLDERGGTDMDLIGHMENEQMENEQKNASQKTQVSPSIHSQHMKHDDKRIDPKDSTSGMADTEKNQESGVQSTPSEFDKLPEMDKAMSPEKPPTPKCAKAEEKSEEKSRVVISQEETEDAVAALLGESFGTMTDDYDDEEFNPTNEGNETSNLQVVDGALIAEEEAEEMRKAVQSLNTEELDMKPDTPQSDNGLQIDTDTEDQDDSGQLQIDVSASSEESKPDTPQPSEKSKVLDALSTPVAQLKTNEPSMQSTPITSNYVGCKKNELTGSDVKPSKDKPLEPPQIMPLPIRKQSSSDSPKESTILVKPNAVHKQNDSIEKAKTTPSGTSQHHSVQAAVQPPQITIQTPSLPSSIQNPLLNRSIAPQIRQPMHMGPAKSSLSHVVIQQRQIIPPVIQKSSAPQSVSTIITNTSTASSKLKETLVVEPQLKPSNIGVPPTSVINTQMPQIPKQIVFETKLPNQMVVEMNKPTNDAKSAELSKVNEQNVLERKLTDVKQEINVPSKSIEKIDDDGRSTPSVISCTSTAIKAEDVKPIDTKLKNIEINSSTTKEGAEYWSAKEINIESVIKKVDALCNATEAETNVGSNSNIIKPAEIVVQKMEDDLTDNNKPVKSEELELKTETKIDGKCPNKRDKIPRNKKLQQFETPSTAPVEVQKSAATIAAVVIDSPSSGVQTRRGNTKTPVVPKRGRNNKNVSPKSAIPSNIMAGLETKPRITTPGSDIYEFHEDSGEESMLNKSNEGTASRSLSISKIHHQPPSPNVPVQTEATKQQQQQQHQQQQPQQQQNVVTQAPVIVTSQPDNKPAVSIIPPSNVLHEVEKPSIENADTGDAKELDSSMAALNNVRKSRRLIERDGSRSTVDDIIEDVVKNAQLSAAKESPSVIATSASAAAIAPTPTIVQVISAQPRRSTRNTSNQATTKLQPIDKVDVRKSPRPNRNAKDRKTSECESSTDERIDEPSRIESGMQEEKKRDGHGSENVRNAAEPCAEPNKSEVSKQTNDQHAGKLALVNQSRIVDATTNELTKKAAESRALIDPVTGELTFVQQSNEGQYLPIMGGNSNMTPESLVKSSVVVTTTAQKQCRQPTIEVTASMPPKITTAPIVTIVNKPIPAPGPSIVTHHALKPTATITNSIPTTGTALHNSYVITSKPVDAPTPQSAIPISMSIEKTLAQSQSHIQIKQSIQQPTPQPIPTTHASLCTSSRTHPNKAHVQTNAPTSVILSNSISTISNVQPVIKSTPVIQCRETQPTVISQQYQPKIQVPVSQSSQMVHGKNTLTVNIPKGSPINLQPTHSPRLPHETQYSIHVPKHSVNNMHQTQILSQTPVVIHSNKMHAPVTSNYTSVVQAPKIIQTPGHLMQSHSTQLHQSISQSIAHTNASMMVQMQTQSIPMQHMPQSQSGKPGTPHQITIQQQQIPQQFPGNIQMQPVRSNATKYKYSERYEGQPATVTKQPTFEHYSPQIPSANRLHQPQIIAVASPPPKQPHLVQQQPAGASNLRAIPPPLSPQGQARAHNLQQPGLPAPGFEPNLHSDLSGYGILRNQSPPPAHQQASPITPGDGNFPPAMRGVVQNHFAMYQQYIRAQEALGQGARIPYIPRTTLVPGSSEQKELTEMDEQLGTSPPLELRRPIAAQRVAVPHSLQSPQDRATVPSESPQVAQVYVPGTRIPHPHYPDARFYESARGGPIQTPEPPPAHRNPMTPPANYVPANEIQTHLHSKAMERERERERERDRELEREHREKERKSSIPGHSNSPSGMIPAMAAPAPGRPLQLQPVTTPPHASQVPPQADSLLMLLQRYPVMWQGLLALKTDQAAVQMHFVFGNPDVASGSLPCNSDGSTPPLRIAQRMRLEQTQLEGVARKMQTDNEHCMLLALPCGRDHIDVLQQSTNLSSGFITYLQQKQAAGIVNIPAPGSEQAAYVVHIFPSCEFANENLARIAPDLLHRVSDLAHLLIVIATV